MKNLKRTQNPRFHEQVLIEQEAAESDLQVLQVLVLKHSYRK